MRIGTPGFQPGRLTEARDSRGLTQVALGELINKPSSSISRWESGIQMPESDALEKLSIALNVPIAFFMRSLPEHGDTPMFFRSMASTTLAIRKRTQVRLRWAQDLSITLQEWVDLPSVNFPCLDVKDYQQIKDEDIEKVASECRKIWNLGIGPIADILLVIENAGAVVVKEEIGAACMDGVSNWSSIDNRPYMFIARDKDSCVRSRLDAAHELGHLILHRKINEKTLKTASDFKEIERQAFYFAGAFLMPAESFGAEIWSPSLNTLLALKERWKTAISAMIMRCNSLGIINENYQRQLWKYYSAKGWKKNEPLDDTLKPENPRLLARSVKLLVEKNVRSREQLKEDFRLNTMDIESLTGLPTGYMSNEQADIIPFPQLKKADRSLGDNKGDIIPFARNEKTK